MDMNGTYDPFFRTIQITFKPLQSYQIVDNEDLFQHLHETKLLKVCSMILSANRINAYLCYDEYRLGIFYIELPKTKVRMMLPITITKRLQWWVLLEPDLFEIKGLSRRRMLSLVVRLTCGISLGIPTYSLHLWMDYAVIRFIAARTTLPTTK